jgi:hypothetical protein
LSEAVDRAKNDAYRKKLEDLTANIDRLDRLEKSDMLELFTERFSGKSAAMTD